MSLVKFALAALLVGLRQLLCPPQGQPVEDEHADESTAGDGDTSRFSTDAAAAPETLVERLSATPLPRRAAGLVGASMLAAGLMYALAVADEHLVATSIACLTAGGLFAAPEVLERGGPVLGVAWVYRAVFRRLARRERAAEEAVAVAETEGNHDKADQARRRLEQLIEARGKRHERAAAELTKLNWICGIAVVAGAMALPAGMLLVGEHEAVGILLLGGGFFFAVSAGLAWYVARVRVLLLDWMQEVNIDRQRLEGLVDELRFSFLAAAAFVTLLSGAVLGFVDAAKADGACGEVP